MSNKPVTPKAKTKDTTKAPQPSQAKRSYRKSTKVATEAKVATNVAKGATEQYAVPTVQDLTAQLDNLTKVLMVSQQKLNSALNDNDKLRELYLGLYNQSWWKITKERFSKTIKDLIFKF